MKSILTLLLVVMLQNATHAQQKMGVVPIFKNPNEGQRKALVLGNQNYQNQLPLQNTLRDADSITVALKTIGFVVTTQKDQTLAQLNDAIDNFMASLQDGDVAFVYYSGHGLGYQQDNYLLPIEFDIQPGERLQNRSISTTSLRNRIMDRGVRNLFLVVDACRIEPGKAGNGATDLVPPASNPSGTLIAFATDYGQSATYKSRQNKNSLYTESLLAYLRQPLEVKRIFENANNRTYAEGLKLKLATPQEPVYTAKIYGDYYFLKPVTVTPTAPSTPVKSLPQTRQYLDLPFADMVYVPGGSFQMGDTRNEGESDEKPVHTVTVSSFLMGKYEVTQQQWEAVMGSNPSYFKDCPDCPVEQVSWDDVQEFLQKLNARTGGSYRLPTEAEWEYAAGGGSGSRTRFGNGRDVLDPSEANFDAGEAYKTPYSVAGEYRGKPVRVGSFLANGLGLHDLSGNVWEWCSDWYGAYSGGSQSNPTGPATGSYRVLRGGGWRINPQIVRVADRRSVTPSYRSHLNGFRVVSQSQ